MTKDQPTSQQPTNDTIDAASQLLLLDQLMVLAAMNAINEYPPSPADTLPSPSPPPLSSLNPDAATLYVNPADYCSSLIYQDTDPSVVSFPIIPLNTDISPPPLPQYQPPTTTHHQPIRPQLQPLPQPLAAVYPTHLYRCMWAGCQHEFAEPKSLLTHLSEDHVGRRQRGNLNLRCQWTGCSRVTSKRDHMVSHLKSHVPFWPHLCTVCGNRFKHTTGLNRHLNRHSERGEINLSPSGEIAL